MDQQQQHYNDPDLELAASVDEGIPAVLNSQRLHQLAATRIAITEEQQQQRRYTWNITRDDVLLKRKIELEGAQRTANLHALRKLMGKPENVTISPDEASVPSQTDRPLKDKSYDNIGDRNKDADSLHESSEEILCEGKQSKFNQQRRSKPESDCLLADTPAPNRNQNMKQQTSPFLSFTSTFATQALMELARRHSSSLSSRPSLSVRTIAPDGPSDREPIISKDIFRSSSSISTNSPWNSPKEESVIFPAQDESYLVQLVHLMEGKPIPNPPNDIVEATVMAAVDCTDGSSLSSLENPTLEHKRKYSSLRWLFVIFIGSNVLLIFGFVMAHPVQYRLMISHGFNIMREYLHDLHALRYNEPVDNYFLPKEYHMVPIQQPEIVVEQGSCDHEYFWQDMALEYPWEHIDLPTIVVPMSADMILLEDVESGERSTATAAVVKESNDWKPTHVRSSSRATTTADICFFPEMHFNQCVLSAGISCRPLTEDWEDIVVLSRQIVIHLPVLKDVGNSKFEDNDDVFHMVPLMDIVGEFFRERRSLKELKQKQRKELVDH